MLEPLSSLLSEWNFFNQNFGSSSIFFHDELNTEFTIVVGEVAEAVVGDSVESLWAIGGKSLSLATKA